MKTKEHRLRNRFNADTKRSNTTHRFNSKTIKILTLLSSSLLIFLLVLATALAQQSHPLSQISPVDAVLDMNNYAIQDTMGIGIDTSADVDNRINISAAGGAPSGNLYWGNLQITTENIDTDTNTQCEDQSCSEVNIDSGGDSDNELDTASSGGAPSGNLYWGNRVVADSTNIASYETDPQVATVTNTYGCYGTGTQSTCASANFVYNSGAAELRIGGTDSGAYKVQGYTNTAGQGGVYGRTNDNNGVVGVRGSPSVSDQDAGVAGFSAGTTGVYGSGPSYGVYGVETSSGESNFGALGHSSDYGVYGYTSDTSGSGRGVYGYCPWSLTVCYGLYGFGYYGVWGESSGTNDIEGYIASQSRGVYGQYDANKYGYLGSVSYGVYGESNAASGSGVRGIADGASGTKYGVYGSSTGGGTNYGVYGTDGTRYGYLGGASYGAYGYYNSNNYGFVGGNGYGGYGYSLSGRGLSGVSSSQSGVEGVSTTHNGVSGRTGGAGTSDQDAGVAGFGGTVGVYGTGSTWGGYFATDTYVGGELSVKSTNDANQDIRISRDFPDSTSYIGLAIANTGDAAGEVDNYGIYVDNWQRDNYGYGIRAEGGWYGGYFSAYTTGVYATSSNANALYIGSGTCYDGSTGACSLNDITEKVASKYASEHYSCRLATEGKMKGMLECVWEEGHSPEFENGDVVCMDTENPEMIRFCDKPFDSTVLSVIHYNATMTMGDGDGRAYPMSLAGNVPVKVICDDPIAPGDLLVTADKKGYAMRLDLDDESLTFRQVTGTIFLKSTETCASGEDVIRAWLI